MCNAWVWVCVPKTSISNSFIIPLKLNQSTSFLTLSLFQSRCCLLFSHSLRVIFFNFLLLLFFPLLFLCYSVYLIYSHSVSLCRFTRSVATLYCLVLSIFVCVCAVLSIADARIKEIRFVRKFVLSWKFKKKILIINSRLYRLLFGNLVVVFLFLLFLLIRLTWNWAFELCKMT